MNGIECRYYRKLKVYISKDGIYIYKKGILVCFSNPIDDSFHQIFLTGKYNVRVTNEIFTLLAYLFDDVSRCELFKLPIAGHLVKKYNNRWGKIVCNMNTPI